MNCAEAKKTDGRNSDQAYEAHGALIHTIGRAITWSIGATAISPTGRYPTSTLTTCKVSSSCLNNKQRVINKATSQSRGRRLQ